MQMAKAEIQSLSTRTLIAIVHSTSPVGQFWQQLVWARDELARRKARRLTPGTGEE